MKISKEQLNEYIKLYLNDVEDYGEDNELIIAETTLSKLQNNLITESEFNFQQVITEAINKSQTKSKIILNDFLLYVENI
jgi:L-lactate utilization protein LutC